MRAFFLLSICSILLCGCTSNRRAIYCRFIMRHKYDDVIIGATDLAKRKKDYTLKAQYWLLAGIAYQLKGQYSDSLYCYDKSLSYDKKYNYFAYQRKAQIFNLKNDKKNEKENLVLALESINSLIAEIKDKNEWLIYYENDSYPTIDFYIGYYIENNKIEDQNQDFIIRLQRRKKQIIEEISRCEQKDKLKATTSSIRWRSKR